MLKFGSHSNLDLLFPKTDPRPPFKELLNTMNVCTKNVSSEKTEILLMAPKRVIF